MSVSNLARAFCAAKAGLPTIEVTKTLKEG